jgi:hypothetical protein
MQVAKFGDLLRHSQTLRANPAASSSSSRQLDQMPHASSSDVENDSDSASRASSGADTYSGSDGDGDSSGDDEAGGSGWGAQAQPAKAGREAKKRQQQQQQQKQGHKLKQQKLNRAVGAASAFVSSLRGRGANEDVVEEIDVGGGSDRKNRMGQRQVSIPCAQFLRAGVALPSCCNLLQRRLLAERKFGSQAKHVAEGLGGVEKRVKGVTKRANQLDPKTGLAIGDTQRIMCGA